MLSKIKIYKLNKLKNLKGDVLKYLNKNNKYFKKFGEVYFTEIKKKKNKRMEFSQKMSMPSNCPSWKSKVCICRKN